MNRFGSRVYSLFGDKDEDDEVFLAIEKNESTKSVSQSLKQLCLFIIVFGCIYFTFGIFSIFYKDKQHLLWFGLICLIHIVGGLLGLMAISRRNRTLLVAFFFSNIIWLLAITLLLIYYIMELDAETNASKKQFKREIVLHVGLFFYVPIALLALIFTYRVMYAVKEVPAFDKSTVTRTATARSRTPDSAESIRSSRTSIQEMKQPAKKTSKISKK